MNETERLILQLAETSKNSEEFTFKLERSFDIPLSEKGSFFLQVGITLFNRSLFNLALSSWNNALTYFVKIGDKSGESKCYTNIGNAYGSLGDSKRTIEYNERSLQMCKEIGDRSGESKCYGNLGVAYGNLGDFRRAIEFYERSLEICKEMGDRLGESKGYMNLGNAYGSLGESRRAIEFYEQSLEICRAIGDRSGESSCYANLGVAYGSLGDFRRAIEYRERSLQMCKDIGDKSGESSCYTGLGVAYYSLGYFRRAIEYHERSLQMCKDIGDKSGESKCYTNLGNAYGSLGESRRAIEFYEQSLEICRAIGDRSGESSCYANLGVAYGNLGDFREAIEYHERSLKMFSQIGDKSGESKSYGNLGFSYGSLGDFRRAIEFYERSLKMFSQIGDKSGESKSYLNLGFAYSNLGESRRAIEFYELSLQIARELDLIEQERIVDLNLAVLYSESNLELAYDYCRRSIQLSEIISEKLVQEDYIMGFRAQASRAYRLVVPLCLKLGKEKEAFEYMEGSKSRAFLELLAATKIKPTTELTNEISALLNDEETYLAKLREIQKRHLRQTNIQVELGETERILQRLNLIYDEIGKVDPEYVSARRAKPISLDNILETLSLLKKATILVEYFVTAKETFIFVASSKNKELHIVPVPLSEDKLRGYVENFEKEVMNYHKFGNVGESWLELSDYLIKPIQSLLTGHDLICFVPYGLLHSLPLHALKLEGERLIKTHPVVYSPSASLIRFNQNKGSGKLESCVSFGVVRNNQTSLELIVEETASGVSGLFGEKAYNGGSATKETALKECANKDVVHFSCHGFFDKGDPLSSGIALYDDNILTAREIFDMKLNAELVTLGACETGQNERSLGDELIGLTRAFLYAGAATAVVTLWSVNADSTKDLLLEFYRRLKNGADKATALQEAQIKLMETENYSHPYYWAPFIIVGKY